MKHLCAILSLSLALCLVVRSADAETNRFLADLPTPRLRALLETVTAKPVEKRDATIEARADRIEGYVLVVIINVLVVHALADAAFAGHALPRIDLASLPVLVFALLSALFGGHIVKQAAIIWQYRA